MNIHFNLAINTQEGIWCNTLLHKRYVSRKNIESSIRLSYNTNGIAFGLSISSMHRHDKSLDVMLNLSLLFIDIDFYRVKVRGEK